MKLDHIFYREDLAARDKYVVTLTAAERQQLEDLTRKGKAAARTVRHAWILLQADASAPGPCWTDARISEAYHVDAKTICRVRKLFVEDGLAAALQGRERTRVYERKLDGEQEAHLIALACGAPPQGYVRWTLRLLRERVVELEGMPAVSHETVRQVLKKTHSSHGAPSNTASHRSRTASSSPRWRMSSRSTRNHTTTHDRWCVWTS